MLDSDVALFFGEEPKRINQQMKRNIERFPEDFCFQLNSKEFKNLRLQNVTSSVDSSHGGRRYMPYVYTRFLILDCDECYSLGTSLNYVGRKTFVITKIEDAHIINSIIKAAINQK